MNQPSYSIHDLEEQERELVLDRFTHEDAWLVGSGLAERAAGERLAVTIDVRRPGYVLFRAAMAGSTADHAAWIDRKAAVTLRFEASSLLVGQRMSTEGRDPFADGWLDHTRYTVAGGSFPIRVAGAGVVGAITVSGLSSEEDHALIVQALRRHRAHRQANT